MSKATLMMILVCCLMVFTSIKAIVEQSRGIALDIRTLKKSYALGEVVIIDLKIANLGSERILISEDAMNSLEILISKDDIDYYRYYGKGQGYQIDGAPTYIIINAGKSVQKDISVLWNAKPRVSHLNSDAAARISKGRILSDLAFPEDGIYFLKAVLKLPDGTYESKPIFVNLIKPTGENLDVWNNIRISGDLAYFMQYNDAPLPSYKTMERSKFQAEIENILAEHPNSIYAGPMRTSLEKYKANEEKRKAFQEEIRRRQKPEPKK